MHIGRYLRVSSTEQKKTLERQQYSLELAVIKLGGVLEESPLFVDVQSGRDNDRPEFLKLVQAIETRSIDVLVAYRVDRLARDLETSAWLGKLFERTGVKLYDFQKEGYVDFSNPEEWESYAHRSVAAESESRRLSKRIRSGFEFSPAQGQSW
jgi:DNA invertase Pin-like site-specific DNA recombinase